MAVWRLNQGCGVPIHHELHRRGGILTRVVRTHHQRDRRLEAQLVAGELVTEVELLRPLRGVRCVRDRLVNNRPVTLRLHLGYALSTTG